MARHHSPIVGFLSGSRQSPIFFTVSVLLCLVFTPLGQALFFICSSSLAWYTGLNRINFRFGLKSLVVSTLPSIRYQQWFTSATALMSISSCEINCTSCSSFSPPYSLSLLLSCRSGLSFSFCVGSFRTSSRVPNLAFQNFILFFLLP